MDVRATTRIRAVLRIYRMHRKPRGGVLDLPRLERDWKQTGLRRADLDLALQDMLQQHLLQERVAGGVKMYELTYLGARSLATMLSNLSAGALHDWLVLYRAKRRVQHRAPAHATHYRRRSDQSSGSKAD